MARRTLSEQLDQALEAMMADPSEAPALAGKLGALLQIAADLRDLPSDDFRARLHNELVPADASAAPARSYIRPGLRALTPYLQVHGADAFIDFMKQAFAAETSTLVRNPQGAVQHVELRVGDSAVEAADASAAFAATAAAIHLYVPDVDTAFARAVRAGATVVHDVVDQPYGDREGGVKDPFGNSWYIATHLADLPVAHAPQGLHDVTPYLHPKSAPQVIDFLKQAFDAEEALRVVGDDGAVVHAKIRLGESTLEMGEAHGPYQPTPTALHLYVRDADEAYRKALAAGASSMFEPVDESYGDRVAGVTDPFGNSWYIATYIGAKDE